MNPARPGPTQARPRPDFWKFGTWISGNVGSKKSKFSKFKSVLPKMLARTGLVGKTPPGPIWGHLRPFSPWTGKIKKMFVFFFSYFPWWTNGPYSPFKETRAHGKVCPPRVDGSKGCICAHKDNSGKKHPGPIWCHFRSFSPWTEKRRKTKSIFLGGPMGPIRPVWELECLK